jgi:hypothetical protein
MNCHDDVFPSRKTDEDIIAERRLFYVGVTRARKELTFTYSKQERSLCRFVREIPRPFLIYHNISAFKLSDYEGSSHALSIADMITGFDGDDWHTLRTSKNVPALIEPSRESIYGFAELFSTRVCKNARYQRDMAQPGPLDFFAAVGGDPGPALFITNK